MNDGKISFEKEHRIKLTSAEECQMESTDIALDISHEGSHRTSEEPESNQFIISHTLWVCLPFRYSKYFP